MHSKQKVVINNATQEGFNKDNITPLTVSKVEVWKYPNQTNILYISNDDINNNIANIGTPTEKLEMKNISYGESSQMQNYSINTCKHGAYWNHPNCENT